MKKEQEAPNLTARIPEELKMWLKLHCVENEISMTGLIIDLIEQYKYSRS